jgi:2-iminobutanoate/2-iminopropanoate deaminase
MNFVAGLNVKRNAFVKLKSLVFVETLEDYKVSFKGDQMDKKIVYSKKAPEPVGPYSQAVITGNMMYCSGMIPIVPESGEVLKGSVSEQAEQVLSNIKAFLEDSHLNLENVVKTMVFLTDMSKFAEFNEIYSKYFNEGKPARSCVAVSELPKGVDVEVEVIATF